MRSRDKKSNENNPLGGMEQFRRLFAFVKPYRGRLIIALIAILVPTLAGAQTQKIYVFMNNCFGGQGSTNAGKIYNMDENGRERWIDYDRVFGILRKVRYNGFISMIYEGKEDKMIVIPKAIRLLRSYVMS